MRTLRAAGFSVLAKGQAVSASLAANRRFSRIQATMFALALAAVTGFLAAPSASAQTATPTPGAGSFIDYAELAGSAKTETGAAVGSYVPIVMSIMIGLCGIVLLFKWVKRPVKSGG